MSTEASIGGEAAIGSDQHEMQVEPNLTSGGVGTEIHEPAAVGNQDEKESLEQVEAAAPPPASSTALSAGDTDAMVAALSESEATLTVRFRAEEGFFFIQHFPPRVPSMLYYSRIESHLQVERSNFRLLYNSEELNDMDVIDEEPQDGQPLVIELRFEVLPPHLRVVAPGDQVLKSVRVSVEYGDDIPSKEFFVTVIQGYDRKPFLGGFRHKKNDTRYHHATTQCYAEKQLKRQTAKMLSRTTQTQGVTRSTQTRRECCTQMARSDLLIDDTYDRIVVAKPYFSSEKLLALQVQKTVQLQAYVRGWRARKIAQTLRKERDDEEDALSAEDQKRKEDHRHKRLQEIERRTHPRTVKDFNVLQNELEAWRLQEVQRIKEASITPEERKVAMMELLKKETKLLQTIDRLQIQASKENRVKTVNRVLNNMSSAKNWGTQSAVNVETPFTIRARELRDLYNGLQLTGLSIDERLDILLHVKWTVKEFECPLSREIVELVDREADLLNRGRKDKVLSGLRQRTSNLFLQFVETPEFNPEAISFQRVPLEYTARPLVRLDKKK